WEAFIADEAPQRLWLYTTKSARPHWEAEFRRGDYLLFGRETSGVPDEVHDWVDETWGPEHRVTLPMVPETRSLNLATVVCAAAYEGLRQIASG
ncbi:MAG: tRNA (cytidine(34)-2'-O)-methyltransferase, partial [Planctomycetota bacterium]